jgi:hypothetical protein
MKFFQGHDMIGHGLFSPITLKVILTMYMTTLEFLQLLKNICTFMVIWVHVTYVSLGFFIDDKNITQFKHVLIPQTSL